MYIYIYMYEYTYTYMYIHTYTHTHIYIYTCIPGPSWHAAMRDEGWFKPGGSEFDTLGGSLCYNKGRIHQHTAANKTLNP